VTAAGAARIAAVAACLALLAFVVALAVPNERSGRTGAAAQTAPTTDEAAPAPDPAESFEARGAPDLSSVQAAADADMEEQAQSEPQRPNRLVDAPQDLLAYAVSCGDLRAIAPGDDEREYEVFGESNACAPGWAPDGRLALVGPLGRPPGSVSSLWLLARNGGTEVIDVPDRSVNGRPAFWADRTVDMCTVSRRAPLRPMLYRREIGRPAEPLAPGCFPSVARDGRLAYAAPADDSPDAARGLQALRIVRVVDRDGAELAVYTLPDPIQDVRFTGDGSRVVVVTSSGSGMAVTSFGGAEPRTLMRTRRGALSIYPSPEAGDLGVVRTLRNGSTQALLLDARTGATYWSRGTDGVTRLAFSPDGQSILVADDRSWVAVARDGGEVRLRLPRLGGEPAWCCPAAAVS
jgi:hypothetical protein